jgi:hypothetical protein
MAITVKHSKVSTIPDDADTSLVRPSDWNADHTLTGTIDIANGGTGQTTANAAFNALAPSQTGNTGKYLTTNGTDTSWATNPLGTVTSVDLTASTGISVSGGPITTSGSITVTNTAPDQVVSLTAGTGISTSGTYPNFTITNTSPSSGGTVTSVGLTSSATSLAITNTPITSSGNIGVNFSGIASQYVRGDGSLANFPTSTGGGSSVSYYLNGSVNQGTFGGNTYYQMSKTPIFSTGTNFNIATNGYITQFITDANDPSLLSIPAGNWNFEMFFSASSSGGTPSFYVELYKYDGTTFTLIASSSASPENITGGVSKDLYITALSVPITTLALNDRLAVRVYVNNSGRTITLHTEDNNLCQVITTFSTGLTALNGLTAQVQYFATGTSGTDFNISSLTDTHTFNIPSSSGSNRGLLTSADWTTFNSKVTSVSGTSPIVSSGGTTPAISMPAATSSVNGYLTSTDWTTFNSKQPAGTYVTSVGATSPITSSGGTTPTIAMPAATTSVSGYLTSTDWNTFNNKGTVTSVSGTTGRITSSGGTTPAIDLASGIVTAGTTGSSTAIPVITVDTYGRVTSITTASNPQGTVTSVTGTAPVVSSGGATPDISMAKATTSVDGYLSATDFTTFNNKGNGTVTSVSALTLGTTGTDLSSTVANGTTTPVITLNVPTASATNRGALSSADWTTFNSKAAAFTYTSTYIPFGQGTTTPNQSANLTFDGTTQSAPIQRASNGIVTNNKTIGTSFTIPSTDNAMSSGPVTLSAGVTVTVSSGSRWVVL